VSETIRAKGKEYARFLETHTPDQIAHGNEIDYTNAQDEFRNFVDALKLEFATCAKSI
jgi:hypothetical protein